MKQLELTILFLGLLYGCRTFTDPSSELYNPDDHAPLGIGTCQPGALWPLENSAIDSPLDFYEKEKWSNYFRSGIRQDLYDGLGVTWLRVDFSWKSLEPEKGVWYFRDYDYLAEAADEQGRKILAVLTFDTPWLYEDEKQSRNITENELDEYLDYVRTVALRYGDRLAGFEIWNEPNLNRFWKGSDEDFFQLTREAVKVLKEVAPDVPVAVGALSYHPLVGGKSFLKKMLEAGALEGADAVSVHPYAISLNASAGRVADLRAFLEAEGCKHRIWVTEMGFPTTGLYPTRVSLKKHFSSTVKGLTLMTAAGADILTWYKIFDSYSPYTTSHIIPSERSFGMITPYREWKPGAYAFNLLGPALEGKTYSPLDLEMEDSLPSKSEAYLYRNKEDITLVLWTDGRGGPFDLEGVNDPVIRTFDPEKEEIIESDAELGQYPLVITGTAPGRVLIR